MRAAAAKLLRPRQFVRAASTATGPKKIAVLAGDGIGEEVRCAALVPRHAVGKCGAGWRAPQVMAEALKVLARTSELFPQVQLNYEHALIGGAAYATAPPHSGRQTAHPA
eukprot:2999651-Prymnesium_polylepis.1